MSQGFVIRSLLLEIYLNIVILRIRFSANEATYSIQAYAAARKPLYQLHCQKYSVLCRARRDEQRIAQ